MFRIKVLGFRVLELRSHGGASSKCGSALELKHPYQKHCIPEEKGRTMIHNYLDMESVPLLLYTAS